MSLKGKGRGRKKRAHSFEELIELQKSFAKEQAEVASKRLNATIEPDTDMLDFIISRTDLCPHKIITPFTYYWLETITVCDGEMGLCLPGKMDELPALFFDALNIVRTERAKLREEENKKKGG